MEECPSEIWERVFSTFDKSDHKTLLTCRTVCSQFKYWADKKSVLWTTLSIWPFVDQNQVEICQLMVDRVEEKNAIGFYGETALHRAAKHGHMEICQIIIAQASDKNPNTRCFGTPLHVAAGEGHSDICQLILDNVEEKNPQSMSYLRSTPLEVAADNKHFEVCHTIIRNLVNKNPAVRSSAKYAYSAPPPGSTFLHWAASKGLYDLCRTIVAGVEEKNPANHAGTTPLTLAAIHGHLDICQLIIENQKGFKNPGQQKMEPLDIARLIVENVPEKNPTDESGLSFLHWASKTGQYDICKLLLGNIEDKNPAAIRGVTPFHVATMHGQLEICKLFLEEITAFTHLVPPPIAIDLAKTAKRHGYTDVHLLIKEKLIEKYENMKYEFDSPTFEYGRMVLPK